MNSSIEEDYLDCSLPPLSPSSFDSSQFDFDSPKTQSHQVPDILDHQQTLPPVPPNITLTPKSEPVSSPSDLLPLYQASQKTTGSTIEKTREDLMSDIERTIMQMMHSITVGEPIQLSLVSRKQNTGQPLRK
ncbi:hypothetical protein A0J61_06005 [Choanephora cucurbitarum]|uniref:Uncharacterized protein n=1 Tax=Choanephora cucurbitarum TaxID=101091 RepID=A0A1C7NA22_9FUNG|nr:hypothetical protein A0J61_06005 [Choanephora cucurbitarum]